MELKATLTNVVEFASLERARAFYDSPKYRDARKLRQGTADARFITVEGV